MDLEKFFKPRLNKILIVIALCIFAVVIVNYLPVEKGLSKIIFLIFFWPSELIMKLMLVFFDYDGGQSIQSYILILLSLIFEAFYLYTLSCLFAKILSK